MKTALQYTALDTFRSSSWYNHGSYVNGTRMLTTAQLCSVNLKEFSVRYKDVMDLVFLDDKHRKVGDASGCCRQGETSYSHHDG